MGREARTKQQTSIKTACDSHITKGGTACPVFGLCTLEQRRDEGHFQRDGGLGGLGAKAMLSVMKELIVSVALRPWTAEALFQAADALPHWPPNNRIPALQHHLGHLKRSCRFMRDSTRRCLGGIALRLYMAQSCARLRFRSRVRRNFLVIAPFVVHMSASLSLATSELLICALGRAQHARLRHGRARGIRTRARGTCGARQQEMVTLIPRHCHCYVRDTLVDCSTA